MAHAGYHVARRVAVVALILTTLLTSVCGSLDVNAPFLLASPREVVSRIATVYYPRPTVILFTDAHSQAPLTAAARESVQRLHADFPASMAAIHEYRVSRTDAASTQLFHLLAPSSSLPCAALFGSAVMSGMTVPGSAVSVAPTFVPLLYDGRWSDTTAMRRWLLAATPTQYSDPVSYRAMPAVHLTLDSQSVASLVKTLEHDVWVSGSRTTLPEYVLFAYAHITTRGSEVFTAALSSLSAQVGERVLTVVTESAELAAAVFTCRTQSRPVNGGGDADGKREELCGLPTWHQVALLRFADVQAAVEAGDGAAASGQTFTLSTSALRGSPVVAHRALETRDSDGGDDDVHFLAQSAEAIEAVLVEASVLTARTPAPQSELMPGVATPRSRNGTVALHSLARALAHTVVPVMPTRGATTTAPAASPLRKLSTTAELQHELRAGYNAIKVVFFMRESDTLLFRGHRKLAEDFARRACGPSVVQYKSISKKSVAWRSSFLISAFWVDAEQRPAFASQLRVAGVPDVVVLLPLSERSDERTPNSASRIASAANMGDRKVGIHHITVHDLTVVETTTSPVPQTAKEAEPMFPTDADQLIRFLADPQFTTRALFNLQIATLESLTMGPQGGHRPAGGLADAIPASIERHYFPPAPEEPSAYLHSLFTGAVVLPPFDAAEYEESARQQASAGTSAHNGQPDADSAARRDKAQQRKAAVQRELQARQQAKEARIREKARRDAEAREAASKKLKQDVRIALQDEKNTHHGVKDHSGASTAPRTALGSVSVMRPAVAAADRADALTQYRWREAQAKRMAARYLKIVDGKYIHLRAGLELGTF